MVAVAGDAHNAIRPPPPRFLEGLKLNMLKIVRRLLYGLAISTGVAGLLAGGVPLGKFAWQWLHDHEYGYYYDPNFLFSPEVVFILSLILLVFVHISFLVGKGIHIAGSERPGPPKLPAEAADATTDKISQSTGVATAAPVETADEKLARLLRQKNE